MQYEIGNYLKDSKIILNNLLTNLFNIRVRNVTFLDRCKLRKMPEYEYSLLKYNVVLEDYTNYTIFIRLIEKEKIEENLFCYWFFYEEYFGIIDKKYMPKANLINYKNKKYNTKYVMEILNIKNKIWKESVINIIDLKEYYRTNIVKIEKDEVIMNDINKLLFIAII